MHEAEQHAEYDLLMQSQFWPADRIRDLQRERLEKLLRHARAHVPFYATRLDVLFRPDGTIDWDRWGEVPTLKRDDLLQHRRAMLARAVPPGHEKISDISTSGSTGKPVTTSHSSYALDMSKAAVFRSYEWYHLDYTARLGSWYGSRSNVAAWPNGQRRMGWGPPWDPRSPDGEFVQINRHTSAPDVLEFMARNRARYMTGGGTDLKLLGYEAERLGTELPLDVALVRSADITEAGRVLMARVFGARTISLYSSKEGHRMAHPCPTRDHWHINDEQVLVEVLDEHDRPCAPGVTGRVVVTPFYSYAQPLLRYEQGDLAVRSVPCTCGRHLSVLESVVGRVKHMFVLADGSRVAPWLSDAAVASLNGAIFQVAQTARDAIQVRFVPAAQPPEEGIVRREIETLLRGGAEVRFVPLKHFEVPAGRKHLEFVSELDD
jgi:phenylacetate-CoA ligase